MIERHHFPETSAAEAGTACHSAEYLPFQRLVDSPQGRTRRDEAPLTVLPLTLAVLELLRLACKDVSAGTVAGAFLGTCADGGLCSRLFSLSHAASF